MSKTQKAHTISLNGRDFITYEGLLSAAHEQGLRSIRTVIVQVPTEQNGNMAIVQAEVELCDRATGEVKTFTGIGDANPRNVNRNIANHVLRMAETRSKARALRDATNIGATAYEELDEAELPQEVGDKSAAGPRTLQVVKGGQAEAQVTAEQLQRIEELAGQLAMTPALEAEQLKRYKRATREELTKGEAAHYTSHLERMAAATQRVAKGVV
jgi:hypothetical protein